MQIGVNRSILFPFQVYRRSFGVKMSEIDLKIEKNWIRWRQEKER